MNRVKELRRYENLWKRSFFFKFLKDGALVIAINLANIINRLIETVTFPTKCKIAKNLLFKQEIKTDYKN